MNEPKSKITTYDIVAIAMMAAFVFVATYFFKIDLPTIGGKVSIKLGNGICILAALLLGGGAARCRRPLAARCLTCSTRSTLRKHG